MAWDSHIHIHTWQFSIFSLPILHVFEEHPNEHPNETHTDYINYI